MKTGILILLATLLAACTETSKKNISATDAYEKYGHMLNSRSFFAFPEVRENPLKWFDSIPDIKLKKIIRPGFFELEARTGEFFVFQIGVWALNDNVMDVHLEFSDLTGNKGKVVSSSSITCFNLGGTDFRGNPFKKQVNIQKGRIQALWTGIDLDSIRSGIYRGSVSIISGEEKQIVPILLKVAGNPVSNHGYNEGSHLSRLNWLNSTVGTDDDVTTGYTPVIAEGNRISILGRIVEIAENGLPSSVLSYFGPSNQTLVEKGISYRIKEERTLKQMHIKLD